MKVYVRRQADVSQISDALAAAGYKNPSRTISGADQYFEVDNPDDHMFRVVLAVEPFASLQPVDV